MMTPPLPESLAPLEAISLDIGLLSEPKGILHQRERSALLVGACTPSKRSGRKMTERQLPLHDV